MSEFDVRLAASDPFIGENAKRGTELAMEAMAIQLERVSGDASGSAMNDYLSPADSASCRSFMRVADWESATTLALRVRRTGSKVWKNPHDYKMQYTKAFFLRPEWEGRGFFLGTFQIDSGVVPVYLCEDARLRCTREPTVFTSSYGRGEGTLPPLPTGTVPLQLGDVAGRLISHLTQ